MTNTELKCALADCTAEVLEQMFFVHGLEGAAPATPEADSDLICGVDFAGEPSGSLTLRLSLGAARSIAADFLGEDAATLSAFQVGHVVLELSNIICGSVLSRIESDTTFRLESPRLLSEWKSPGAEAIVHSVILDTGVLTVELSPERPVCPVAA